MFHRLTWNLPWKFHLVRWYVDQARIISLVVQIPLKSPWSGKLALPSMISEVPRGQQMFINKCSTLPLTHVRQYSLPSLSDASRHTRKLVWSFPIRAFVFHFTRTPFHRGRFLEKGSRWEFLAELDWQLLFFTQVCSFLAFHSAFSLKPLYFARKCIHNYKHKTSRTANSLEPLHPFSTVKDLLLYRAARRARPSRVYQRKCNRSVTRLAVVS